MCRLFLLTVSDRVQGPFEFLFFSVYLFRGPFHLDTFPSLVVNGVRQPDWVNVRMTDNHYDKNPVGRMSVYSLPHFSNNKSAQVTDVHSANFRCYDGQANAQATTIDVAAGSQLGIAASGNLYHAGVSTRLLNTSTIRLHEAEPTISI